MQRRINENLPKDIVFQLKNELLKRFRKIEKMLLGLLQGIQLTDDVKNKGCQ